MMIVMKATATEEQVQAVIDRIESVGARAHPSRGEEVTVIGAIGDREHVARLELEGTPGVAQVVPILKPYKLASSQVRAGERTVIDVEGRKIGGEHFSLIAGPVHRRVARPDADDGLRGGRRRRVAVPRRRVQAAHVAVRVPGPRSRGPATARGGARPRPGCRSSPR